MVPSLGRVTMLTSREKPLKIHKHVNKRLFKNEWVLYFRLISIYLFIPVQVVFVQLVTAGCNTIVRPFSPDLKTLFKSGHGDSLRTQLG